jgi:hypothetical protein
MKDRFIGTTPTRKACFSTLNLSYLDQHDAFEVNHVVRDWPKTTNPFTLRIAQGLSVGSPAVRIPPRTFMEMAESLSSQKPARIFTFSVKLEPTWDNQKFLTITLIETRDRDQPPIMADNAGFFEYAMAWFSKQAPVPSTITLSITSNALFWVH